jgi:hypothetical protein
LCDQSRETVFDVQQLTLQLRGGDELDVLVDEIQAGFELCQQVQQLAPHPMQRSGQAAGQLPEGDIKLGPAARVNDRQHGFGLRQIQTPGQEGSQREFSGPGQPSARGAHGPQRRVQHGRRTHRMQLGQRLTRIASRPGPEVQIAGDVAQGIAQDNVA